MGKIGDLFVRLGLKKEGFSQGMKQAQQETQTFGNKLKNMKAGAIAVWAAIGTAVVKFAQDMIGATNRVGDAWAAGMSNMKAQYHTLLAEISNYKPDFSSFKNFFKNEWGWIKKTIFNAKEAGEAASEMTKAFDAEFELVHSIRLQRGAIQQELNELQIAMRDTTLSPADRMAAVERYKALLQPLADAEVAVYGNMMSAAIKQWQAGTGLDRSEADIIEFFTNIGTNAQAMIDKFPDINEVYEGRKGDKTNLPIFDIIAKYQDATNQMSGVERELGRITNGIKATMIRSLEDLQKAVATYGNEEVELDLKLNLDFDEEDLADLEAFIEQTTAQLAGSFKDKLGAEYAEIENMNRMLAQSMTDSFSGGLQAITDFLMGVDGSGVEQIMSAFIQPIANMMKGMGEMFMAQGIAELALISGPPQQKIAAGAALIAISSAIASGLSKMSSALGGTSASTSAAGTSTAASSQKFEQEITINVVGEISGDKIILAGQKTLNKWSR